MSTEEKAIRTSRGTLEDGYPRGVCMCSRLDIGFQCVTLPDTTHLDILYVHGKPAAITLHGVTYDLINTLRSQFDAARFREYMTPLPLNAARDIFTTYKEAHEQS